MRKCPDAAYLQIFSSLVLRVTILILLSSAFSLLLPVLSPVLVMAQEKINTKLHIDKPELFIGDPFVIEIEIEHPATNSYEVKLDKKGMDFFELRERPEIKTERIDGQLAKTKISLSLTPFQTGKLPIPPFIIARNDGQELRTEPLQVDVTPLISQDENTIKDFRLLSRVSGNGWVNIALIITFMAAAGIYLVARFTDPLINRLLMAFLAGKQTPVVSVEPVMTTLTVEEDAIAKLQALLGSRLAQTDIKQFYVQLAEIITDYAVIRYGVLGKEYTSADLMEMFIRQAVPVLVVGTYEKILLDCDLVKFARQEFSATSAEKSTQQAIDLLKALSYQSQLKNSALASSTATKEERPS